MDIKSAAQTPIKLEQPEKPTTLKQGKQLPDALEREKIRLRKATDEFESFFVSAMLKSMRQTIPRSEDNSMGGGLGKDIFESMFDSEIAKTIASKGHDGVGDRLYATLESRLVEQFEQGKLPVTEKQLRLIQNGTEDKLNKHITVETKPDVTVTTPINLKED